jgi:RNA polymerase-binding transcription factor DksA
MVAAMNKAEHFIRTGQGICDECDAPVEAHRTRGRIGPFLCQRCANAVMFDGGRNG